MTNLKKLPNAIKFALFASAASLATGNAFAQEAESTASDTKTLDRIEVTGSRIKRADIEGALPVTVISRQDIEVSGKVSVAELLQNSTFNSFGSVTPASGSSAQSFSELSLRGLGGGRTLILIDGRRAPTSPQSLRIARLPSRLLRRLAGSGSRKSKLPAPVSSQLPQTLVMGRIPRICSASR